MELEGEGEEGRRHGPHLTKKLSSCVDDSLYFELKYEKWMRCYKHDEVCKYIIYLLENIEYIQYDQTYIPESSGRKVQSHHAFSIFSQGRSAICNI